MRRPEQPSGAASDAQDGSNSAGGSQRVEDSLRLRLLCPHSLVPLLIGKKGENVKQIRRETGAQVFVADPVLGCDERVVQITGESLDDAESTSAADALCSVFECLCQLQQRRADSLAAMAGVPPTSLASPSVASPPAHSESGSVAGADEAHVGESSAAAGGEEAPAAVADGSGSSGAAPAAASEAAAPAAAPGAPPAACPEAAELAAAKGSDVPSPVTVVSANGSSSTASRSSGPASAAGSSAAAGSCRGERVVEARLLVDSQLVGYLVGRGGATIKETVRSSGAAVRILSKPELPACACIGDEVVRASGSEEAVAAALRLLAAQIKAHPARLGALAYDGSPCSLPLVGGAAAAMGGGLGQPPPLVLGAASQPDLALMHPALGGPPGAGFLPGSAPAGSTAGLMAAFCGTAVEVTFRLLAPANRAGNIIGKGGEHIKRVRSETGARVKVFDPAPGSEERVVALTSSEDALSPYCAAQDALIRCVIALTADESPNSAHRVRLLTAQASVGIVLGKRGATVSQLRHETGASIKVVPAEVVPVAYGGSFGSDDSEAEMGSTSSGGGGVSNGMSGLSLTGTATTASQGGGSSGSGAEEVIQVEGTVHQCVAALRGVATLLRGWQIRRLTMAMQQHHQSFGAMQMHHAAMAAAAGGLPMSPGAMQMAGAPMSPPSPGIMLPPTLFSPSPAPYMAPGGPRMMPPPPPTGPLCSYAYRLSPSQVGAVLGKGGAHINQIRHLSGARVQLQDELEGGGRMMVVTGMPEQCHTAHSMANAFLSMGRCEPTFPEPMG